MLVPGGTYPGANQLKTVGERSAICPSPQIGSSVLPMPYEPVRDCAVKARAHSV